MRGGGVMTAERIKALREARGWTQAEYDEKRYQFMGTGTFDAITTQLGGPRQTILCIDRLSAWRRKS